MSFKNPHIDEDFEEFEAKIDAVLKIFKEPAVTPPKEPTQVTAKESANLQSDLNERALKVTMERTVLNKKALTENDAAASKKGPATMDKYDFMAQMEEDANQRAKERKAREEGAAKWRCLGNEAFRAGEFEKAVQMYTSSIELIKNHSLSYVNRALSYMNLGNFKRSIADVDYVLFKLEEQSNLKAWLYRALGSKRLGDEVKYEESIEQARKCGADQVKSKQVEGFIKKINEGYLSKA